MVEPHVQAWADQFGALLRDKCRQMILALEASGWDTMAHVFVDPDEGDSWRLQFVEGQFVAINLDDDETATVLDLHALGVFQ